MPIDGGWTTWNSWEIYTDKKTRDHECTTENDGKQCNGVRIEILVNKSENDTAPCKCSFKISSDISTSFKTKNGASLRLNFSRSFITKEFPRALFCPDLEVNKSGPYTRPSNQTPRKNSNRNKPH